MKQLFFIAFVLLLILGCTKHDGYTLLGHVPEAWEGKSVVLMLNDVDPPYPIDSTRISGGAFKLQGKFDIPRYCNVVIYLDPNDRNSRNNIVNFALFIDSTAVEATCDNSGKEPVFHISGSSTQIEYQNITEGLQPLRDIRSRAFRTYTQAYYSGRDPERAIDLAQQVDDRAKDIRDAQIQYIKENPGSVISLKIAKELSDRNSPLTLKDLEQIFLTLTPDLQNSDMGKTLRNAIQRKQVFIGAHFLDKELVDPDSNKKKISDFVKPGCTTLIEFWASWCGPCREEFPHIRRTYERYHSKGFNIVSISIDSDTHSWLTALKDEKLPWKQLLDQNRLAFRAYNLTGVPSSILLDKEGNIINLDARGGWLDAELKRIYDK